MRTAKYYVSQRSLPVQVCAILHINVALNTAIYELMYCGQEQTEVSKSVTDNFAVFIGACFCVSLYDAKVTRNV